MRPILSRAPRPASKVCAKPVLLMTSVPGAGGGMAWEMTDIVDFESTDITLGSSPQIAGRGRQSSRVGRHERAIFLAARSTTNSWGSRRGIIAFLSALEAPLSKAQNNAAASRVRSMRNPCRRKGCELSMSPPVNTVKSDERLPATVDVVVVGGGIIGCLSAYYLGLKRLSVAVIEKGYIACEQSSRNWGWCRQTGRDS